VVETVAQALKLPYVAMVLKEDDQFTTAASYGTPTGNALKLGSRHFYPPKSPLRELSFLIAACLVTCPCSCPLPNRLVANAERT